MVGLWARGPGYLLKTVSFIFDRYARAMKSQQYVMSYDNSSWPASVDREISQGPAPR